MNTTRRKLMSAAGGGALLALAPFHKVLAAPEFRYKYANNLPPTHPMNLRANEAAAEYFDSRPPSYRRTAIHWVISAKREATRERRLAQLIEDSAAGRTLRQLTPPGARR